MDLKDKKIELLEKRIEIFSELIEFMADCLTALRNKKYSQIIGMEYSSEKLAQKIEKNKIEIDDVNSQLSEVKEITNADLERWAKRSIEYSDYEEGLLDGAKAMRDRKIK